MILVVSCARALGVSGCFLVFNRVLDGANAVLFLLSFASSILPFSELRSQAFATWNYACKYMLYVCTVLYNSIHGTCPDARRHWGN
jgi:hypothetical protein